MLKGLLFKELVLLATAFGVGASFSRLLPRDLGSLARLALAPAFGYAAIVAVLTSVNYFVPLEHAFWFVVLPMMLVSVTLAFAHRGPDGWRLARPTVPWGDLVRIGLVVLTVFVVYSLPLDQRNSQGPVSYAVADGPGYVTCIDGFAQNDTGDMLGQELFKSFVRESSLKGFKPDWSLTAEYCDAFKFQHVGSMTWPAAVAPAFGWHAWATLAPLTAVFAVIIGLGALALFTSAMGTRGLWGVGAGLLAGGPVALQLSADGSVGYLAGMSMLPGIVTVGVLALRTRRWRTTFVLGVLAAGLQTSYPELAPTVVLSVAVALIAVFVTRVRAGAPGRELLRAGAPHVVALGALSFLLAPRAGIWAVANSDFSRKIYESDSLPKYFLRPREVLGWLTQTREFYSFANVENGGFAFNVVGIVLPLLLIAVAVWAAWRRPVVMAIGLVSLVATAQAVYLSQKSGCSYCVDRSMLIIAPLLAAAMTAGLAALAERAGVGRREVALMLASALAIAAGTATMRLDQRIERGAIMPPGDLGTMARNVEDKVDGTLQIEGFDRTPFASYADLPTTYSAMTEVADRVSVIATYNDYNGFSYLRNRPPEDPAYTPDYDYVLSRMTGLDSGRQVVAQTRTMALYRRTRPFDAVLARGAAVDSVERDPAGTAWLQAPSDATGPLTFWVSARDPQKAYLRATVAGTPDLKLAAGQAGKTSIIPGDSRTEVCMPVPGTGPRREVSMVLEPLPSGVTAPPADPNARERPDDSTPIVTQGIRLDRVLVDTRPCSAKP